MALDLRDLMLGANGLISLSISYNILFSLPVFCRYMQLCVGIVPAMLSLSVGASGDLINVA